MFENFKIKLWDILEKKQISLAMIFDKNGNILWHKGRRIEGKSIQLGIGFPKSCTQKIINDGEIIIKKNIPIMVFGENLPDSARGLNIKSLMILPIKENLFLYIDSGTKDFFSDTDLEVLKVLGELLEKTIDQMMGNGQNNAEITGNSIEIKKIKEMVIKFAIEDEPVLITGETGVGKSHIAELIHRYSGRKGKFVVAEITSINENLFENTMFGHKKGSFTDAKDDKKGLVQEAENGTLFLDEISEIPIHFQAKLLRFIEHKKYRIIGDSKEKMANIRILAASNKNLKDAIKNKEFREDLYYRLHILEIEIPPLRNRKNDIKAFILNNKQYLKGKEIGDGFWDAIFNHEWPGNMRELIAVLKRAGILLESPITGDKIKEIINFWGGKKSESPSEVTEWQKEIWENLRKGIDFWQLVKKPYLNRELNRNQVKSILSEALTQTSGNYKDTLKLFNIPEEEYGNFMKFLYRNQLT